MALEAASRVKQTTSTEGTSDFELDSPAATFRSFVDGVGDGGQVYYVVTDGVAKWEIGIGTVTAGTPDQLSRDTVLQSSNADAKVNFDAGAKTVFLAIPGERLVFLDMNLDVTLPADLAVGGDLGVAGALTLGTPLAVAEGGTGAATAAGARTNLGLGAVAVEDTVPVAKGGTGATGASAARTNLELGSGNDVVHRRLAVGNQFLAPDGATNLHVLGAGGGSDQSAWLDNLSNTGLSSLRFRNDGNERAALCFYGSAHATKANLFEIEVFGAGRLRLSTGATYPSDDNSYSCGTAARRWSVVYAATGTINTSDARDKTVVAALTAAELAAAKALAAEVGTYRFLAAIDAKGDDARHHAGLTVQRAIEVMEAHGLDPLRYGFICHDSWEAEVASYPALGVATGADGLILATEISEAEAARAHPGADWTETQAAYTEELRPAGDRYSFRPDELLLFIARGFDARLAVLEAV